VASEGRLTLNILVDAIDSQRRKSPTGRRIEISSSPSMKIEHLEGSKSPTSGGPPISVKENIIKGKMFFPSSSFEVENCQICSCQESHFLLEVFDYIDSNFLC
jgi:hypothetical protein